jgi:prepilin-type N-terminal cleavage/methylation domain-containing protein
MIHIKNHNKSFGFSFIEIVIAIAIIGILLTALFNLQNTVFNSASREHSRMMRIFNIKNLFFNNEINQKIVKEKQIKQNIEDPQTLLTYQALKPSDKSALKRFNGISILKATGTWQLFNNDFDEIMVSLLFTPDKKKEGQK